MFLGVGLVQCLALPMEQDVAFRYYSSVMCATMLPALMIIN